MGMTAELILLVCSTTKNRLYKHSYILITENRSGSQLSTRENRSKPDNQEVQYNIT